ncbi:hypothetical protein [Lysinibacillus sp.]|uniref:hypothetical protein n=1 Tax=Lysinibacillus sp. TaxID=1869345 RepID=UPI00289BD8D0|nr:hypothetical protein [Lysinibacillus sp.]
MKKIKVFTMLTVLLITSLGLFSIEKADAASSGWVTQNGVKAQVTTTKDTYSTSEKVVAKFEKTGTGKLYYIVSLDKLTVGAWSPWEEVDKLSTGSFTTTTPELKLTHAGKGTYRVLVRVFKDAATNEYIGYWSTDITVK